MSHFTVLVVGEDIEKQLAPYQENNMGDCPEQYLEFHDKEPEGLEEYEDLDEDEKAKYPTFESYMETGSGYSKDKKTGKYGYWENPNRKWDWYTIGGRWSGMLKIKSSCQHLYSAPSVDSAIKKHIDFEGMRAKAAAEAAEKWDKVTAAFGDTPPNKPWSEFANREDHQKNKEEYWAQPRCKAMKSLGVDFFFEDPDDYLCSREEFIWREAGKTVSTFAFVRDGKWAERGKMGWWACVSNENGNWDKDFAKLLADVPDDARLTMVDCHI